ncbi:MAG: hypothetical protein HYR80_04295 [Nitrospirae bacterium]|nr:hypothetical protein [Nitrospirota bacterium]
MIDLKLIFFDGCPNVDLARRTLQLTGFQFEEVNQNNLPEGHPLRNYTSPTIIKGSQVIFGTTSGSTNGGACSLESMPTAAQLLEKIVRL